MKWQYHKQKIELDVHEKKVDMSSASGLNSAGVEAVESETASVVLADYLKFLLFSFLLVMPVYAMVKSFISDNWLMLIIDILLVPVGFVHGILLLFGIVG